MATAGPNFPTAGTDGVGDGPVTWTGPTNIFASDNVYATAVCAAQRTHWLKGATFGFAVPAGQLISDVFVEVEGKVSSGTHALAVAPAAANGGFSMGFGSFTLTTVEAFIGAHFTPVGMVTSDINASTFDVWVEAGSNYTGTISIDSIRVTVTYAPIPAPTVTNTSPSSGSTAGGTPITITGTGFQNNSPGANTVTINGVSATSVSVINDTTITCTTGASAAGTYNVLVTNSNGVGTQVNGFTYVVPAGGPKLSQPAQLYRQLMQAGGL